MSTDAIKKAISELRQEDEALAEQERKTARRRAQISTALSSLLALDSEEPLEFKGTLADACRHALTESTVALTAPDVRDAIRVMGYNLSKHTNILASIHNALKRFEQSRQAKAVIRDGQTAYEWLGKAKPVMEITTAPKPPTPLKTVGSMALGKTIASGLGEMAKEYSERFQGVSVVAGIAKMMEDQKKLGHLLTEQMKGYEGIGKYFTSNVGRLELESAMSQAESVAKNMKDFDVKGMNAELADAARRLKYFKFP